MVCLLFGLITTKSLAILLHFITSPHTPFDLRPLLADAFSDKFVISNVSSVLETAPTPDSVLFDYSYDPMISIALLDLHPIVMWPWDSYARPDFLPRLSSYSDRFTEYLLCLNFTGVTLITDDEEQSVKLTHELTRNHANVYPSVVTIPRKAGIDYALKLVGRVIKPSGGALFAIVTGFESAFSLLTAFNQKNMNKPGVAFVLSESASYFQQLVGSGSGLLTSGVMYVAQAVSASAHAAEERELMYLQTIARAVAAGATEVDSIIATIDPSIVLVNIDNGTAKVVANHTECERFASLAVVLPGNSTVIPRKHTTVIPVSVNYWIVNPDGSVLPTSRLVMRGAEVAIEEGNNRTDLLPSFEIRDSPVGLSGNSFDYEFTKRNVIANREKLGLIHFPMPGGVNIWKTFNIFTELNITLPMSMTSGLSLLASPSDFPLYLRTRTGNAYTAMVIATMFKFFGWRRLAVIYSKDNGDNEDLYHSFLNYTDMYGLTITNEERNRGLTESISKGATEGLNATITEIMNSTVRIVMILHYDIGTVLEAMYDLGVRSQYLICTWTSISYFLLHGDGLNFQKRRIVGKGALQFFPRPFIGDIGAKVLQWLIERDGLNYYPNSCFYYDSVMLYLYATDYMIKQGIDYENPYEIVKAMRGTHFKGCSGTIAIAPGTNEKAAGEYSILNVKYFEGNTSVLVEDVMYFNPFSVTLFKSVKAIMWPDNSTEVFTDTLISTSDCPFLEADTHSFTPGKVIGFSVTFGICALTCVVTGLIWKRWWDKRYPTLRTKQEISADDILQLLAIPIQFFQFAAMGPNSLELNRVIAHILESTTLKLENVLAAKGETYWVLLHSVFPCVAAYTLLSFLRLTQLEKKLEWMPLWSFVMLFANLALPVSSNLLFLPIVSCLSTLYLCYHSTGDSLTSSYLNKDCYTNCWSNSHISYVIGSSAALAVYIPLGVYTKPMWQESQPVLHIRAQPLGLMVKSVVQVFLLAVNNSLSDEAPLVHAGLFFTVMVAYIVFMVISPQYNYSR